MTPSKLFVLLAWATFSADANPTAGKATYDAKCASCHGSTGKGDGPAATALPTKPPDMTLPAYWKNTSDHDLETVITKGKPNTAMRGYSLKPDVVRDVIAYLHTLERKE